MVHSFIVQHERHEMEKELLTSITAFLVCRVSILVAARSNAWIKGRSFAAIAGSNSAEGMDVCRECCALYSQ